MNKNYNDNLIWETVEWPLVTDRVRKLQRRIYKTKTSRSKHRVYGLQKLLINSLDAKLLAVRMVTTSNKGDQVPGIGKQVIPSHSEKMSMARNLGLNGKAYPIKRYFPCDAPNSDKFYQEQTNEGKAKGTRHKGYIFCKVGAFLAHKNASHDACFQKKERESKHVGIPVIQDRAKQALAKLALEPEWEAVFEPNSYGFRPGRSAHDAIEALFLALSHNTPKWVFHLNIRKNFHRINHSYLLEKLETFPQMKDQISAWLEAGVLKEYANISKIELAPTETLQNGGDISLLLSNIALHGLEHHLKEYVSNLSYKTFLTPLIGRRTREKSLSVVRYASDFVIIHAQPEILDLCIDKARKWLLNVGLEVSTDKSVIRDCRDNFHFLGFTISLVRKNKEDYKVKIIPSRESQLAFLDKARTIIKNSRSISTYHLISRLRRIVVDWANYFKFCECSNIFTKQSYLLYQMTRHWVFRRHPQEGRTSVKERYWPSGKTYYYDGSKHQDNWVLCGKTLKGDTSVENFLPQMSWVHSRKFVKIQGKKSPFDSDNAYWATRNSKYSGYSFRVSKLCRAQGGVCTICKHYFDAFSKLEVDHIVPRALGGKEVYSNLQLLHESCYLKKTANDRILIGKARKE